VTRSAILDLRFANPTDDAYAVVIQMADFVRRKALEAAEANVLNRTGVTIPAKDWEAFESWLNLPAKSIPALKRLIVAAA
jgi:uncharacterized protein (DUF1778 family)